MAKPVAPPPPPGFQLLFEHFNPLKNHNVFNYAVLPIHWSIVREPSMHIRLINGSDPDLFFTEILPTKWEETVKTAKDDPDEKSIQLYYKDVSPNGEIMRLELTEIRRNKEIAISLSVGSGESVTERRDEGGIIDISKLLDIQAIAEGKSRMTEVYKMQGLWDVEKKVHRIVTGANYRDPYGSNIPKERLKELEEEKEKRRKLNKEMEEKERAVDPIPIGLPPTAQGRLPPSLIDPLRDLGRSDLDPFGGREIGIGGGMLLDPRGLRNRNPLLPPGIHPPGARFDPVGPPGGGGLLGPRGGIGPFGGRGGPRIPFAFPEPDHERAPGGYEDMFS